jgi:hypothetical protein
MLDANSNSDLHYLDVSMQVGFLINVLDFFMIQHFRASSSLAHLRLQNFKSTKLVSNRLLSYYSKIERSKTLKR